MFRKTLAVLVAAFLALFPVPASAANGETVILLQNSDGSAIGDVTVQVRTQDGGTNLSLKTDKSGRVGFPSLKGKGTLEINNCVQAATSFALQIYDANFGDGSLNITLRLPERPRVYDYEIKSPDGLTITKPEDIGRGNTPSVNSYIRDSGTLSTEIGKGTISSCGTTWYTRDTLRVAPFLTSNSNPEIAVPETVEGGVVTKTYSLSEFVSGQKKTITVSSFKYLQVTSAPSKVYERQSFRLLAHMKGLKDAASIPQGQLFSISCEPGFANAKSGALSADYSVSLTASISRSGKHRCGVISFGQSSSFGIDVEVLPIKTFNVSAAKKYKSCAFLNAAFEGGLAKSTSAQNSTPNSKYLPALSASGYKLNAGLDRDKDGIACEQ